MEPDHDIAEHKSYVSTEFFFYMLPNYLAIVAFAYRYYNIMQHAPKRKVDQLPGQIMVTCFEEVYDDDYFDEDDQGVAPASYCIKSKLSLLNSVLYLLMCLMGLLGDPDLFYAAQHRSYSFVYFFGVLANQMSAYILRRQYQRQMTQSLWSHRFFWIFSGTFSISKMFEDYLQPLNFFINSTLILTNGILALYGLYRAEDKGDAFLQIDTETPSFAKLIFQQLELDPRIRKILRIKDEPVKTFTMPGDSTDLTHNELQQIQMTIATSSPQQQLQLLNKLPKRNIFVDRKIRTKLINQQIKYFFVIISQMNVERFEAERKYSEFQQLDYSLSMHYSAINFPKLQLPRLKKDEFNRLGQNDSARRAQILEVWLQALLQNPIFVNQSVLDFLGIDSLNSAPFITYYNASYKNFCSKAFLYTSYRQKNNIETRQQRVSILKVVQDIVDNGKLFFFQAKNYQFEVGTQPDDLKAGFYTFELVCRIPSKSPLKWEVKKQQEQFLTLNNSIQDELRKQVPFYYQCMLKIPQSKLSVNNYSLKKLDAYAQYLRKLLINHQYHSFALFKFINFDFVKGEVVGDHKTLISYQSMNNYKPKTNFQKSWKQISLPIEVNKIVFEEKQFGQITYTFTIIFNDIKLSKTHFDIVNLRNHLLMIYKGLTTVPQIYNLQRKIMQQDLDKVKAKTDEFLCGVIALPQIKQNPTFETFITTDII